MNPIYTLPSLAMDFPGIYDEVTTVWNSETYWYETKRVMLKELDAKKAALSCLTALLPYLKDPEETSENIYLQFYEVLLSGNFGWFEESHEGRYIPTKQAGDLFADVIAVINLKRPFLQIYKALHYCFGPKFVAATSIWVHQNSRFKTLVLGNLETQSVEQDEESDMSMDEAFSDEEWDGDFSSLPEEEEVKRTEIGSLVELFDFFSRVCACLNSHVCWWEGYESGSEYCQRVCMSNDRLTLRLSSKYRFGTEIELRAVRDVATMLLSRLYLEKKPDSKNAQCLKQVLTRIKTTAPALIKQGSPAWKFCNCLQNRLNMIPFTRAKEEMTSVVASFLVDTPCPDIELFLEWALLH